MNQHRHRRRIIPIIDARFQWKYTLLIIALGVGVSFVMGALLYRTYLENTRLLDIDPRFQDQVMMGDRIFLVYMVLGVVLMAVVLGVWGLIVTHRISGPLYIVARYLDVMAEGQYPDVRPLRKRDELQEFFASFEEAVNALRSRDVDNLRQLEEALKKDDTDQVRQAVEKVRITIASSLGIEESASGKISKGVAVEG